LTGCCNVPGHPVDDGTRPSSSTPEPKFVRNYNGSYSLFPKSAPHYIFAASSPSPNNPNHFFISIELSFPNRKPIPTYALIDCGASTSCISDRFSTRHSLPRRVKDIPVPIIAVDDRPLASGLITHDVPANISVDSHFETRFLSVVSVSYPVILGLDWLRAHNPNIDWEESNLTLNCCGLTRSHPVTVSARGSGLFAKPSSSTLNSSFIVGLGFGLSDANSSATKFISPPTFKSKSADLPPPVPDPPPISISPPQNSKLSYLSSFSPWNGFGHSSPPLHPPPNIKLVGLRRFTKCLKSNPNSFSYIRFLPTGSPAYLRATSPAPHSDDVDSQVPPPSDNDKEWLSHIPQKYMPWLSSVFARSEFDKLPNHRPYDVDIELEEGKTPPFGPLYRLTREERENMAEYVNTNLKRGHIRRSTSSAGAPILFTRKKTGELRLCVDFRGLNAITKKNRYPLPLVNDLLDRVQGCSIFSLIDLKSAYSHIRIKEGDEWKTAFRTPLGLFEHLVTPYGLTNAPAAFQSFIQDTLRDLLDIVCVVYIDDILIFSRSQEEHNEHVKLVLDRLRDAHLCANPAKCEWDKSEVEFLGYIIGVDGIKMNPKKLDTITNWPVPTSAKEIQQFLGFTNFYRRFIDSYSRITIPLTNLTKKNVPFHFSEAAHHAFETLKQKFISYPVLRHFDPSKPSTLSTDASDFALSGILLQPDDLNRLHPVAYWSRKMSPSEINYEIHDKELLAIIDCFRDMRAWLLGSPFPISVISDHKNLEYFMTTRTLNRRQARWAMFLTDYDFRLDWAPGRSNVADAPSRRPDYEPKKGDDTLLCQDRRLLTAKHTERLFSTSSTSENSPPPSNLALTTLSIDNSTLLERFKTAFREDVEWREAVVHGNSDFVAESGLIFHKGKLFVPKPLRADVLYSRHDSFVSGHPGRNRTFGLVSRDYSWPGMQTFVRRYVEACDTCPRIKDPRHKPYGLLQPLDIPTRPWKSISMDFIVKLPLSHGFDSIWVVCDRLTRMAHFIPCCESMSAPDLAWLFLDRIFRYHGLPDSIISDRGSIFVSKFWSELLSLLKIDARASTAYHPQTDGLTERTNQTIETYLRAYCSYQQDDWVDYLPLGEFSFNNLDNSSTNHSPFFANYAFHPTFEPKISERSSVPAAGDLASRLDQIHAELTAELRHAQDLQSKYYNKKVQPAPELKPDQLVWLRRRNIKTTRPSLKLDHRLLGPYPISHKITGSTCAYRLNLPSYLSRLYPVFHISLLEPYHDPSEFHPHSPPQPIELADDPANDIKAILDCRKIGHRYEYFIQWKSLPDSENSWIPLSDIPTTFNELIERFHRRHPRAPHPHIIDIDKNYSISHPSSTAVDPSSPSENSPSSFPLQSAPASSSHAAVPPAAPRPASPPAVRQRLRSEYVPPTQTTTRSGRVSRPKSKLDPLIPRPP